MYSTRVGCFNSGDEMGCTFVATLTTIRALNNYQTWPLFIRPSEASPNGENENQPKVYVIELELRRLESIIFSISNGLIPFKLSLRMRQEKMTNRLVFCCEKVHISPFPSKWMFRL